MAAPSLTPDEFTVLSIAAQGQSMMAIGRWEKSTKSLAKKKYLNPLDSVNYVITLAGQAALDAYEDDEVRGLIETNNKVANNKVANAKTQTALSVEEAAKHLAVAAKASALVTGDEPAKALHQWMNACLKRAGEIINNG